MQRLNEDIKTKEFKQVYLLYGEETYLRNQYRDKLRDALLAGGDAMNLHCFSGKNINCKEIIDLAETMPFLSERRVIVLEDSGFLKKGGEDLAEYLTNASETTYFIFNESEVDKRSRLFKSIKENGRTVEMPRQTEDMLKRWILGMIKRENKQISANALDYFLQKTGTDMENIQMELEKIFCYTLQKESISIEAIESICTKQISNQIFDMMNAIGDRNQRVALDYYYDLLSLKEPPMRILFLLVRQFNLLLQVKELKQKANDNKTIASKTGLPPFVVGKYLKQAEGFPTRRLRKALEDCEQTDEDVKSGRIGDRMGVEMLIIQYSMAKR